MSDLEARIAQAREHCNRVNEAEIPAPDVVDLFPDEQGLPEIRGSELTAERLAAGLLMHGGLLVRELYSPEQLALLQAVAERDEVANREAESPLGCSESTLDELLSVYQSCGLLDVVRSYLGDEAMLFAERAKLRHHRAEVDKYAALPWHQDVNFFGRKSYAVNCWAAITSCGDGNPSLSLVPARNGQVVGWDEKDGIAPLTYGRALSETELETACQGRQIASPSLRPGDALLFDEMTLHQTASRLWSVDSQIVTISWFFRASGFPNWGSPLPV